MQNLMASLVGLMVSLVGLGGLTPLYAAEVNIYSYRKPQLLQPMLDAFTAASGVTVNAVFAQKGLLERLQNEGVNTPADVVLTVDIGRLSDIKNADLTQAVESAVLTQNLPANYRDTDNHWFGLTARARVIATAKQRVAEGAIESYEDLAAPVWRGRICTRSGKHPYNVALVAMLLTHHGLEATETWLRGVKANLARRPQGNDRAQVKAIKEGVCDVAVLNHYYLYAMATDAAQKPWVDAINVVFPNQAGRGTHVNISGMAMTKYAPNRANALKLMEFLASNQAQAMYAEVNGEYPVNPTITLSEFLQNLGGDGGRFKFDAVALAAVAAQRAAATKLLDRVGYDE